MTPDTYLVDVLLLCTQCREPIKARVNTPNWLRVEWIGPSGECLKCYQQAKKQSQPSEEESGYPHFSNSGGMPLG